MPNWLGIIVAAILGSGGLAGVIAPYASHKLQQRREREREERGSRAAWVARRRDMCISLLDAVIRFRSILDITEPIHRNPASRFTAKKSFQIALQGLQEANAPVLRFRRELDMEPDSRLQEAVDRYAKAAIGYQQALWRPFSQSWNPVRFYFAKTSPDELGRLLQDLDTRTHELQAAVREYMASLEHPVRTTPTLRPPWHLNPQQH